MFSLVVNASFVHFHFSKKKAETEACMDYNDLKGPLAFWPPSLFYIIGSGGLDLRPIFILAGFWGFGEIGRASCRERVC